MPTQIIEYIAPMKKIETAEDDNDTFFKQIEEMSEKYNPRIYQPDPTEKPVTEKKNIFKEVKTQKFIVKIPKPKKEPNLKIRKPKKEYIKKPRPPAEERARIKAETKAKWSKRMCERVICECKNVIRRGYVTEHLKRPMHFRRLAELQAKKDAEVG